MAKSLLTNKKRVFIALTGLFTILIQTPLTEAAVTQNTEHLSRGAAVNLLVKSFDLEIKNKAFLDECKLDYGSCLFSFEARTNFKDLKLDPLILYPDVYPAYRYYQAINVATELDLVRGYFEEENSPFKPEQKISRIEAIKLVLGAAKNFSWKDQFELTKEQVGAAITGNMQWADLWNGNQWWYGLYANAAIDNGLVKSLTVEEAEQPISEEEFLGMMAVLKK